MIVDMLRALKVRLVDDFAKGKDVDQIFAEMEEQFGRLEWAETT